MDAGMSRIMGNWLWLAVASLILAAVPNIAYATGCGTTPVGVVACYLVNVVNTQGTTTSTGLQVMFNGLPFNATAGNVLVYNGISGATLPAWAESNSLIWVNLGSNVISGSASANGIYYFGLGSPSTNFFLAGNGIGEAPQLSSTYGQYDNGYQVFNFYDNFNGMSLGSEWTVESGYATTVNNGVTVAGSGVNWAGVHTSSYTTTGTIVDIYGEAISNNAYFGVYTAAGACGAGDDFESLSESGMGIHRCDNSGPTGGTGFNNGVYGVVSAYLISGAGLVQANYVTQVSDSTTTLGSASIGIMGFNYGSTFYQWIRDRTYPPDGVMPQAFYSSEYVTTSTTTSTSTTTTSTTTSTSTTVTTSVASTSIPFNGVITTIPLSNVSIPKTLAYSFGIPFFGLLLVFLIFGIAWIRTHRVSVGAVMGFLTSLILFRVSPDIVSGGVVLIMTFTMIISVVLELKIVKIRLPS